MGVSVTKGSLLRIGTAAALVLLLPLAGAATIGKPIAALLQFPPKTPDAPHAPFSLPVFLGLAVLVLAATVPLLLGLISFRWKDGPPKPAIPFPWWGWAGAALGAASWTLAWSRLPWMGGLQAHTFTPLWIAFILLVDVHGAEDGPVPDALPDAPPSSSSSRSARGSGGPSST